MIFCRRDMLSQASGRFGGFVKADFQVTKLICKFRIARENPVKVLTAAATSRPCFRPRNCFGDDVVGLPVGWLLCSSGEF
ncbi:hypothetical protein RMSM_03131 [Rhodopirellula maiorica SM1]|uniref:Uncharacterized protein n=1 Tax=Rhodopirellula maiorica SM1 TaxID=1265738 RepID=M5RKV5_9BACT|nr:hypothetical protein RMSM_03131 [Rhodopirellula maiorica SM1]